MDWLTLPQAIVSIAGVLAIYVLNRLTASVDSAVVELKELSHEVSQLNSKVAVVIQKGDSHDKELDRMRIQGDQVKERLHELGNAINTLETECNIKWAKKGV
jgi:peptidoglycan hydrolase CwlO-like protein